MNDADMMVYVLRNRRPLLVGGFLFWLGAALALAVVGGVFLRESYVFSGSFASLALAAVYLWRIVRLHKKLEELGG